MTKFEEISINDIQSDKVLVFGCGNFGRQCRNKLNKLQINISGYIDNDSEKWDMDIDGVNIMSPQEAQKYKDDVVIIAIEKYTEVLAQLHSMNFSNVYVFCYGKIYRGKEINVIGISNLNELRESILQKKIKLVGRKKYIEDFMYIFDWLNVVEIYENETIISVDTEKELFVVCDKDEHYDKYSFLGKGYEQERHMVLASDLFCLLDGLNELNYYKEIPSIMMRKTWNDSMKNQYICKHAFEAGFIGSGHTFHCCCTDWSIAWGHIGKDSLDVIWKSVIAKIFRLSLINRTYSFCNPDKCVYLKMEADECNERMQPIPEVPEVPKYFEIGIDKTCNLYCRSCRDCICTEQNEERITKVKQKIIESGWLDKVDTLLLGGQGEVFFSKVYKEIMFESKGSRKSLELRTNGTLITKEYLDMLIDKYKKLSIIISIDAATKETYDYLRRSNNPNSWDDLQKNLRLVSEYRSVGKIKFFQINMCVQMKNYKEIPAYINMGMELDVDRVYITPIRNWGTYKEEEFKSIGIFTNGKKLKPEVEAVVSQSYRDNSKVLFAF